MRAFKVAAWTLLAAVVSWAMPGIAAATVSLSVGDASGQPGDMVTVVVSLAKTGSESVGSIAGVLNYQASTPIAANGTTPVCQALVTVDLSKFGFLPTGCTADSSCTSVKATLLNSADTAAGDVFQCTVAIAADATPGSYDLMLTGASFTDPAGTVETQIDDATGTIMVLAPTETPLPTETSTITVTPTETNTPEATNTALPPTETPIPADTNTPNPTATVPAATATPVKSSTPLPTATVPVNPTSTAIPPGFLEDDGCQISASGGTGNPWLLLIPAAVLIGVRRRRR